MERAVRRGLSLLALFGVYLLLVDKLTLDELAAGATVALLATVALEALREDSSGRYALRIAWLGRLASLPWTVLKETRNESSGPVSGRCRWAGSGGSWQFRSTPTPACEMASRLGGGRSSSAEYRRPPTPSSCCASVTGITGTRVAC